MKSWPNKCTFTKLETKSQELLGVASSACASSPGSPLQVGRNPCRLVNPRHAIVGRMEIRIREAVRDNADAIAAAHIAAWRAGYTHIFSSVVFDAPDFDRSRIEMWHRWSHSPTADRRLIVATADGRVVGFAHTGHSEELDRDEQPLGAELLGFYAHPDVWGTPVATLMMDAAVARMNTLGHDRAVLWTLAEADRACAFYSRAGWTLAGRTDIWTHYPNSPVAAVEFELKLDRVHTSTTE